MLDGVKLESRRSPLGLGLAKRFGAGDFRARGVVTGLFSFDTFEVGALKAKLGLLLVNSTVGAESSGSESIEKSSSTSESLKENSSSVNSSTTSGSAAELRLSSAFFRRSLTKTVKN